MLRNIYAPTDFKSVDRDPAVSVQEKLSEIAESPVTVSHNFRRGYVKDEYIVRLPYTDGALFHVLDDEDGRMLVYTDHVNIGDQALYGNGIGTRLLVAGLQHALEMDPRVHEFSTGWARLGLINTAVAVLGESNVGIDAFGQTFGYDSDRALEEVFDEFPPDPGKKYMVNGITARIDHDRVSNWESPSLDVIERF